ncbi:ketoacyl-ACP synthase III [Clostridium sp. D2Q-11]|uniref:Ketoacyl-ACP synthase III n=1 Tax=Anaeromonas frigoriresistens TaxID=2683708 RepID=A0A942UU20_9FIRM|nr:ketoacyl-ACP synthase III [Anaeromonas frigoriresistens]MBS4538588.1 ketoacyl-ACP synthase III [Anaeromonas frigoriresistens]
MFRNVLISGVGAYNPGKEVKNETIINHFRKYQLDEHVTNLLDKLGRDIRKQADDSESMIGMGVKASKEALKEAKLRAEDIDMIISATDTPQYLMPSCALMIRNELKASNATSVFDLNNNCVGMISAIDVASRYLKTDKKFKRALIVGSLHVSPFAKEDDMITYSIVGDGAAAVILESKEEEIERGLLATQMFTDDNYNDTIRFPECGLHNIVDDNLKGYDRKMQWKPFDFSFLSDKWSELVVTLLDENEYKPEHVSHYFMSQFSKDDIKVTLEKLGNNYEQATFIADKYGYTGSASPIMALNERLKKEKFKDEELIVFCSVAAGYTMQALSYKW